MLRPPVPFLPSWTNRAFSENYIKKTINNNQFELIKIKKKNKTT